ncbi:MAG: UDP-N-acetylmuramoyl-L-alanine--D-glutamate ligase [Clostridiales bacterium]|jgi:UDP-N-acetylmuramoylalanine--D-glutamate ligase|nr:UDP-N-acetylmuramoyl-L-alanine--D-glutamate ligase [Clostridiales bacterium]
MDIKGKKICVCGMARSGMAAAELAARRGAAVTITDLKPEDKLSGEVKRLEAAGIKALCGKNPENSLLDQTDILIISPGIRLDLPFVEHARKAGALILPEIEFGWRFCRCHSLAVTGTNGKTTTASLLAEIMKLRHPASAALGNIGEPLCARAEALPEEAWAVLETSSFQLEAIVDFKPEIAALTQITPDHLDRHKTMENYAAAKARIFENQDADGFLILNYDDESCREMSRAARGRVIYFSRREEREVSLKDGMLLLNLDGLRESVCHRDELRILGDHNLENAMCAIACAAAAGVPLDDIRKAVTGFAGVPHRIEFAGEVRGVRCYNDSKATNSDSAIKGLLAMRGPTVLIGGGYDKSADFSEWAALFAGRVRKLILIGETAEKIAETCRAYGFTDIEKANSLKDAVTVGFEHASPGDNLLLSPACASWDMFDNYEQRGDLFKEFVGEMRK